MHTKIAFGVDSEVNDNGFTAESMFVEGGVDGDGYKGFNLFVLGIRFELKPFIETIKYDGMKSKR